MREILLYIFIFLATLIFGIILKVGIDWILYCLHDMINVPFIATSR